MDNQSITSSPLIEPTGRSKILVPDDHEICNSEGTPMHAVPINRGMDNAPMDRRFLCFAPSVGWVTVQWDNERQFLDLVPPYDAASGIRPTHWCDLPGDPTK
jgi:hypothetical protein